MSDKEIDNYADYLYRLIEIKEENNNQNKLSFERLDIDHTRYYKDCYLESKSEY